MTGLRARAPTSPWFLILREDGWKVWGCTEAPIDLVVRNLALHSHPVPDRMAPRRGCPRHHFSPSPGFARTSPHRHAQAVPRRGLVAIGAQTHSADGKQGDALVR